MMVITIINTSTPDYFMTLFLFNRLPPWLHSFHCLHLVNFHFLEITAQRSLPRDPRSPCLALHHSSYSLYCNCLYKWLSSKRDHELQEGGGQAVIIGLNNQWMNTKISADLPPSALLVTCFSLCSECSIYTFCPPGNSYSSVRLTSLLWCWRGSQYSSKGLPLHLAQPS